MLNLYNILTVVNFCTRIQNGLIIGIDNIFIDTTSFQNVVISSTINGLLNHNAQLLLIKDLNLHIKNSCINQ